MTQTATVPNPYLPVEAIFDTTDPGWLSPDASATFLTPGHIDATTFNARIDPIADVPVQIDPETIRHEWLQLSLHEESCVMWDEPRTAKCLTHGDACNSPGNTCFLFFCGCGWFTGVETVNGRAVHLIDATADAPGAVAVTWAEPAWDEWNAGIDRLAQARRQPIEVTA